MDKEIVVPDMPYQAGIVGQVFEMGMSRPPVWIEVVMEVQRWS
ncbi:hypothetical protein [Luteibacter aegosomatis]|nr:hypothetical protein [Luteibacter aegosomatis]